MDDLIELNKSIFYNKLDGQYIDKQRSKKNRYYSHKQRKKSKKDKSLIIQHLEETGTVNDYISPKDIEDRMIFIYKKIIRCNKYLFSDHSNISKRRIDIIESYREKYVTKFINLSSIIIGSLINRFNRSKSPEISRELYNIAIIAILKMLKNESYDYNKAKITSWVYEISRQAMVQYIQNVSKDKNRTVILF